MSLTKKFMWLLGALVVAFSVGCTSVPDKQRLVIQASDADPAKWNLALNNAQNVQQALGKDKVDIEIVAYGPGLDMLKFDSSVTNRLTAAGKDGVVLLACGTTMKKTKVTEKDLHDQVKVVPAGVVEIIQKQRDGWNYIRP